MRSFVNFLFFSIVSPILLLFFKSKNEFVVNSKMLPDESGISILCFICVLFDLLEESKVAIAAEYVLIPKLFANRVPTGIRPT